MISLGVLERCAQFFHTDQFEAWDQDSESFVGEFTGRLYPFDRFKTIYHRPTRRETLGVSASTALPASGVMRHSATDEIFIVSAISHTDSDRNAVYDRGHSVHRQSHLMEITRPTIQGAGDDLGALADVVVGKTYIDLELRTTEAEREAYEKFKGRFFVTMPYGYIVQSGDFLSGDGIDLRVELVYDDGGYQMARADTMDDKREILTYKYPLGTGAAYSPTSGTYTPGTVEDRLFSALVSPVEESEEDQKPEVPSRNIVAYIEFSHIGFDPQQGAEIVYDSISYIVSSVKRDPESAQWVVSCRRGG